MNFLYQIPGYFLLLFGAFCLSWGGFIVRSFETSNAWEILLLRTFFFFLWISTFLFLIYKKDAVKTIKKALELMSAGILFSQDRTIELSDGSIKLISAFSKSPYLSI